MDFRKIKTFFNLNFWQSLVVGLILLIITAAIGGYMNWDWVKDCVLLIKNFGINAVVFIWEFLKENIWIIAKVVGGILAICVAIWFFGFFRWIVKKINKSDYKITSLETEFDILCSELKRLEKVNGIRDCQKIKWEELDKLRYLRLKKNKETEKDKEQAAGEAAETPNPNAYEAEGKKWKRVYDRNGIATLVEDKGEN